MRPFVNASKEGGVYIALLCEELIVYHLGHSA
jgi:hypothetical protein